jgi:hypothetical protein
MSDKTLRASRRPCARDDDALAEHAAEIRRLGKQTVENVFEIGRHLTEAKAEIKRLGGSWGDWLEAEFKWSDQQARRCMHVFERKSELNNLLTADLPLSAFYMLAAPSTPPEARDAVTEQAKAGELVTVETVKQTIAGAKRRLQPARKSPRPKPAKPHHDGKPAKPHHDGIISDLPVRLALRASEAIPGPTSPAEVERLNAYIEQLQNDKRRLEIENTGLRSEIAELKAKLAELTSADPLDIPPYLRRTTGTGNRQSGID